MTSDDFGVLRGRVDGVEKYCRIPVRRKRASAEESIDFLKQNMIDLDDLANESKDNEDEVREIRHAQACICTALDAIMSASAVNAQLWIPVTERKPDLIPCNAGTAYSEAVLILTSGRKVMEAIWDGIDWIGPFDFWEASGEDVTHWMPLPELPKEGTYGKV